MIKIIQSIKGMRALKDIRRRNKSFKMMNQLRKAKLKNILSKKIKLLKEMLRLRLILKIKSLKKMWFSRIPFIKIK